MNAKCGVDIIEVSRIENSIKSHKEFVNRVFTRKEIEYCESKKIMKYQHYAARFAAKEAVFKAISEFLESKYQIEWKDIEIENSKTGKPHVNILNLKIKEKIEIDVSLSHLKDYAIANCIVYYCSNKE